MSDQTKSGSKSRILVSMLAGIMILLSLAYTPPRNASASTQCAWWKSVVYYTDATYSTSCGRTNYFCEGEVGHGGCFTSYTQTVYCDCF
jgi:hypothetical protein